MEILKISKELQGIFDSLPFYVMLVDSEHTILFTNRAINKQIEIPVDQMIGRYCPKIIHGMDHPIPECPIEEALEKKCSIEKEIYDQKHDRWVISSIYITDFISSTGTSIFLHMIYDITDKKRLEKEKKNI